MIASKLGLIISVFVSVTFCQVPPMLTVQGVNDTSATISTADLARLPQQTVKTTDHGTPVTFDGALLTDVLAKVALPTGEKFHSTAASYYLTVEAKDGYPPPSTRRFRLELTATRSMPATSPV